MNSSTLTEAYISVDVETAGPYPERYSLLSIGACTIAEPRETFYVELKPVSEEMTDKAISIHGLSLAALAERGLEPAEAMSRFEKWLADHTPPGQRPVFVAFNAAFDWMFINYYFYRYLGHNPFGHAALDIKAFYMGLAGVPWAETTMKYVGPRYLHNRPLTHQALHDALDQANIFHKMLLEALNRGR